MEKKITKKAIEFFQMEDAMSQVSNAPGFKFQILLAKNLKVLKAEVDLIREKSKFCDEFAAADKLAEEIKRKYSNRDAKGEPIILSEYQNGQMVSKYDIPADKNEEFEKEIIAFWEAPEPLEAKNKQEAIFKEYDKFLKEEDITLELFTIPTSCIPVEYFDKDTNIPVMQYFVSTSMELFEE